MRYRVIALFSIVFCALAVLSPGWAEEAKNDVKGLFLLTDYPAVTLRPGTNSTINLRLQNYALPPERLELSVSGAPSGWTATRPVAAGARLPTASRSSSPSSSSSSS